MQENLLASWRQSGQKQDPCPSLLNHNAKYKRLLPPYCDFANGVRSISIVVVGRRSSDDPRHVHARLAGSQGCHPGSPESRHVLASKAPQMTSGALCTAIASGSPATPSLTMSDANSRACSAPRETP